MSFHWRDYYIFQDRKRSAVSSKQELGLFDELCGLSSNIFSPALNHSYWFVFQLMAPSLPTDRVLLCNHWANYPLISKQGMEQMDFLHFLLSGCVASGRVASGRVASNLAGWLLAGWPLLWPGGFWPGGLWDMRYSGEYSNIYLFNSLSGYIGCIVEAFCYYLIPVTADTLLALPFN